VDESFVEVLDLTVLTETRTLQHTIRFHEGDTLSDGHDDWLILHFGPKDVIVAGQKRSVPGRRVSIPVGHIVEISRDWRIEPRTRTSVAALINPEQAEIKALAEKLGVAP
jgi:hypothetical protein